MTQRSRMKFHDETQRSDGSVESSTITFESAQLTAANFDAQRTLWDNLVTSTTALSLGLLVQETQGGLTTYTGAPVPAADPDAQRERKWKVVGYVNSGARGFPAWSRTIPCADITNKLPTEERLDPAHATYTTLKADLEAYATDNGDPIIVERVILVGRNL